MVESQDLPDLRARRSVAGISSPMRAMTVGAARRPARGAVPQWRRGVSIGEVLATARRRAGLSVTQVSQRTRIGEPIIAGIEG